MIFSRSCSISSWLGHVSSNLPPSVGCWIKVPAVPLEGGGEHPSLRTAVLVGSTRTLSPNQHNKDTLTGEDVAPCKGKCSPDLQCSVAGYLAAGAPPSHPQPCGISCVPPMGRSDTRSNGLNYKWPEPLVLPPNVNHPPL